MENTILFSTLNIDKAIQLAATYNFIHGHGILLSGAYATKGLETVYIPFQGWPPGFTILHMPLGLLTDHLMLVNQVMDCIFIFLVFMACRMMITRLFFENRSEIFALFCLINAFNFSPFRYFQSTDLYALAFFLFACCFTIDRMQDVSKGIKNSFLISFLLFLAAVNRFAYIIFGFVIPAAIMLSGKIRQDQKKLREGFLTLFITGVMMTGLLLFQRIYYEGTYLKRTPLGFHPGHLLKADPFIFHTLFYTESVEARLIDGSSMQSFVQLGELGVSLALLAAVIYFIARKKSELAGGFGMAFIFILIATTGMLSGLSLVTPLQSFRLNASWTYVSETRYYAPVIMIFEIYFIAMIFTYKKNWLAVSFRYFTIFILFYSILYFSFKHYKVFIMNEREGTRAYDCGYVFTLCDKLKQMKHPDQEMFVATKDELASAMAITSGAIPILDDDALLSIPSNGMSGKRILVECNHPYTIQQKNFIDKHESLFAFSINDKYWYQVILK